MKIFKKSPLFLGLTAIIFSLISFSPAGIAAKTVTLKLAHIGPTVSLNHKQAEVFAKLVDQKTKGSLKIDLYPAGQLGSANKTIKGLTAGTVDIVPESLGRFSSYAKGFKLLDLPFHIKDSAHAMRVLASPIGQELLEQVRKKAGLIVLNANLQRLPRQLYTRGKPVFKPEDMKGMKLRVKAQKQFVLTWKRIGAEPIVVAYSELHTALSQGLVDAMEGTITTAVGRKFYQVVDYLTVINYTYEIFGEMMSERRLKSLSPAEQKALKEAAFEAGEWYSRREQEDSAAAFETFRKNGVPTILVDVAPFKKLMEGLPEQLEAEGEWEKGLWEKFQKIE